MKKPILVVLFALCLLRVNSINAQTAKVAPPSDKITGYVYDVEVAIETIIEHQIAPSMDNKEAEILVKEKGFPILKNKESLNDEYVSTLKRWIEENSNAVIIAFKNNKNIVFPY